MNDRPKMNQRLSAIKQQAHLYALDQEWYVDSFEQRFAELIVAECIDICNQAILQNQDTLSKLGVDELAEKMIIHGSINRAQKLGKGIKEHFGVEE